LRQSPVCIYCTKFEPISKTNDAEKAPRTALQVFGQCVGLQCGLGFVKTIFWGKGFGKTFANFPARRKGLGRNAGGIRFRFFRKKIGGYLKSETSK